MRIVYAAFVLMALLVGHAIHSAQGPQQGKASNDSRAGEQINWQVLSSGATQATSTNFSLDGTAAQTAVGSGSSTNYLVAHGFWYSVAGGGPGCCVGIRGNVDGDAGEAINIVDMTYLVAYLFSGGAAPPCFEEGDMTADTAINIVDMTYLVAFLFSGGPAPAVCP